MSKEVVDGKKTEVKAKSRYPKIDFDRLQIYFNYPYIINLESAVGELSIKTPTMREYVSIGENKFLNTLNIFTTNTTEYRLLLWDAGVDWNNISDFDLFCMLYKQIDFEVSKSFFGEVNFSDFELMKKDEEVVLYNQKLNIEINEEVYQHIAQYIRILFRIFPEEKITNDPTLKNMYIQKDRSEIENKKKLNKNKSSYSIQPMVSACVNHPGFKYKLAEVLDMSIYEFYDSVGRLNVYESTTAVLKGMYSGFVDGSKFKPDDFNFMRGL